MLEYLDIDGDGKRALTRRGGFGYLTAAPLFDYTTKESAMENLPISSAARRLTRAEIDEFNEAGYVRVVWSWLATNGVAVMPG